MWAHGGAIWERLIERLEDGSVLSLGVSVQSPVEALAALACPDVVHLQLPFNLLDWRWLAEGFQTCLAARPNVTVHARQAPSCRASWRCTIRTSGPRSTASTRRRWCA